MTKVKKAIAIRHIQFEDLGVFYNVLVQQGYEVTYYDAGVDDLTSLNNQVVDLLIILGAPIGAYDETLYPFLQHELNLIQHRLQQQQPILGICLGAQLMARVLGANVQAMVEKEIGFSPLQLTDIGCQSVLAPLQYQPVLHWHGDQFDIPSQAQHLAVSSQCQQQAFAIGNYALALQFHIEADLAQIERWLIGHHVELMNAGIDIQAIREDAERYEHALSGAAEQVLLTWLTQL